MNELEQLGWDESRQKQYNEHQSENLHPARVACASSGRYRLLGMGAPAWAVARKKLTDPTGDPTEAPAVGDWVLAHRVGGTTVVEQVLSRRSCFLRKAAGTTSHAQVIATNLDRVFVVTAVGADFNPRRIERYLAAVWDGGAEPVVVVNKSDLPHDRPAIQAELDAVALGVSSVFVSAQTGRGLRELFAFCAEGMTVALVGSSGVGKSTLINCFLGSEQQTTRTVREKDEKGRHTTTRQELVCVPFGAILVDTPGMREFGLVDSKDGFERTFADITALAESCRFRDCTHTGEPDCAVEKAVGQVEIKPGRLDSYHRLQREIAYNAHRADQRTSDNPKKRWKDLSKVIRDFKTLKR